MKKYLILSFLFLLAVTPALAKGPAEPKNLQTAQQNITVSPAKNAVVSPTGNQVKNANEVQTQNQGQESQASVKTQESEQLNQAIDINLTKVSDQVHELIDTVGAKGGIGQQVKEIAQSQTKLQDEIKNDISQLNSRGALSKFFIGSDKKLIKSMEQKMEQNRLIVQQLEELKLQIKNSDDLQQLQETIDSMVNQSTSLKEKVGQENKINGIFGWLINLFNR